MTHVLLESAEETNQEAKICASCRSIFVPEMSVKVFSTKSAACFMFHHNLNRTGAAMTHNSSSDDPPNLLCSWQETDTFTG